MKQKLILLAIALQMFINVPILANDDTYYSDFTYAYKGVSYKVSFTERKAYADGLADSRNLTDVNIQGFTMKGSDIYSIKRVDVNKKLEMGGETVDPNITYTFTTTMVWQGFKGSAVTSVQMENTVTTIMADAFMSCTNLKSIQLSSGISEIPQQCFKGCSKLSAITIPANIKTIGYEAFRACSSLANVSLSYGLQTIAEGTFDSCSSLVSIDLPNSVSEVGIGAFIDCKSLESIVISDNLKEIATTTFMGCEKLSSITFGENSQLETIRQMAFSDCNSLKEFSMPKKLKTMESSFSGASPFGKSAYDYTGAPIERLKISDAISASSLSAMMSEIKGTLTTVTFGKNPTLKNLDILKGCEKLQNVEIPASVTSLSANTFYYAQNLKEITSKIESPFTITDDVFNNNTYNTATLHVPSGYKATYKNTAGWKNFKTIQVIGGEEDDEAVTLTANNYTREYGEVNPSFEYETSVGTITSGTPTITCEATETSPVGVYPIIINKGSVTNEDVSLVNGTLTIIKAPLTIKADDCSKTEGEDNPVFTLTYSGFKNGETKSVLTKHPTVLCSATKDSKAGTYLITASAAEAKNYDISYENGTLTIREKTITSSHAYAIYKNGTLTFYYDTKKSQHSEGIIYDIGYGDLYYVKDGQNKTHENTWLNHKDDLLKVVFDSSFSEYKGVQTLEGWFKNCTKLESIQNLKYLNTDNVHTMTETFRGCSSLVSLDLSSLNTQYVTSMFMMFSDCSNLKSLDISNFNTANVKDMAAMFADCSSLPSINVKGFNTQKVKYMYSMFSGCTSLTSLDLSSFITENVETADCMLAFCNNLKNLTINANFGSSFSGSDDFDDIFEGSQSLKTGTLTITGVEPYEGSADIFDGVFTEGILNSETLTGEQLGVVNNTWRGGVFTSGNIISNNDEVIATIETNKPLIEVAREQGWIANDATQMKKSDAEKVTDIGTAFKHNSNIVSLVELEYFSNLNVIPSETFYNCSNLVTITIPNSVTSIGNEAFASCKSLTSITIPNSVVSIGDGTFHYCFSLNSVIIPNSVKSIGTNPFIHCRNMVSISVESGNTVYDSHNDCNAIIESSANKLIAGCMNTIIPNSITSIGVSAFEGCTGMKSITIPNSVKAIEEYAFCNSSVMTSVTIPSSVIYIGEKAFFGCSSLTSIDVEEGNAVYDSRNSCNAIINSSTNQLITGCVNTIIPQSVTSIGADAFAGCIGLTSFTIPQNVTSIGKQAFWYCNNLASITVEIFEPLVIDENTFSNRVNAILYVPKGCVEAYSKAEYWKDFKKIVEIDGGEDDSVLKDGDTFTAKTIEGVEMTFKVISASDKTCQVGTGQTISIDKDYSGSITIPETVNGFKVTNVAFEAFSSSKISSVIIGNNVRKIDQNAFLSCQRLISVTFPNNDGFSLGYWPFQGCTSLETVTLPKNLISMDNNPFMGCSSLTYIGVDENNPNFKSVDGVVYSKDTKAIYAYPCNRQSTVYEIIVGTQVIGNGAFISASKLEKVHIPNSVSQIYASAFMNCSNLNKLILPPDITYIPQNLALFSGITEVLIPNKVTSIDKYAFYPCNSLNSVIVEAEEPLAIDEYTFGNRANVTLYVPKGCVEAYSKAEYWKDFKQIMPIGDANGDGAIDDTDVEEAVDFIMDRPSEKFVETAADMNGDGVINVVDIVLMNAIKAK